MQKYFLRGVAALHSFWYPEALAEFEKTTKADPNFAMGYCGQAMTYTHPLWEEQDLKSARAALSKLPSTLNITKREQDYIHATRLLFGKGNKTIRDEGYSKAMESIYKNYRKDLEAACFYSLSLFLSIKFLSYKIFLKS